MTDKNLAIRTSNLIAIDQLNTATEKVSQMLYEVYGEYFSAAAVDEDVLRKIKTDYDRIRIFLEIAIDYMNHTDDYTKELESNYHLANGQTVQQEV